MLHKKHPQDFILYSLLIITLVSTAYAQDDYEKWLKKEQAKFSQFVSEEDRKFAGYLKEQWQKMELNPALKSFEKPKPIDIPIYKPDDVPSKKLDQKEVPASPDQPPTKQESPKKHEPSINVIPIEEKKIIEKVESPPIQSPEMTISKVNIPGLDLNINNISTMVDFYGSEFSFFYNERLNPKIKSSISNNSIADFWLELSSSDFNSCLAQARYHKEKMKLNDWGYMRMIYKYAKNIYTKEANERILFTWFMLTKSGYMSKVGYRGEQIFLLIASDNMLYGFSYYYHDGDPQRYYLISLEENEKAASGNIYTYKKNFPDVNKIFDLSMKEMPHINEIYSDKEIKIDYNGKKVVFNLKYNKSLIDYLKFYPQTDYPVYFASSLSDVAKTSIIETLGPHLKGKSELYAVNFILRFVQFASEYKLDADQFGREKPFFPEESIYYNYSDCEDRSILFSYLVKNLIGLDVIGLDYPNHVATAVKFSTDHKGDFIEYKGKKYLICDPTYFNADAGICMPSFINVKTKIIEW